uniref:hypothetical protein n=1 Tax=Pontiella sp. TaxID=2837462 RepID=UPI0035638F92
MNKIKMIPVLLAAGAFAVSSANAAVTIVDDSFDDGDIGSNTLGVGTGFASAAVVSGASVTETNGVVILDSSL